MIRSKPLPLPIAPEKAAISDFERVPSMLGMIDYLIVEARQIEPMSEYFLRMARMSLLEAEQKRADLIGRH